MGGIIMCIVHIKSNKKSPPNMKKNLNETCVFHDVDETDSTDFNPSNPDRYEKNLENTSPYYDDNIGGKNSPERKNIYKHKKQSSYIPNLIKIANDREREISFIEDCKEARNRNLEEEKCGKTERYVTASYRRKIEIDRKLYSEKKYDFDSN